MEQNKRTNDRMQRDALRVFLSLASVIYLAAMTYSIRTGNTYATWLLVGASVGLTIFLTWLLLAGRPPKNR